MGKTKILITGKNSYIGTSFMKWVSQWPDRYAVEAISVRGEEWRNHDFSKYDSVLHVAGIAHVSANPKLKDLYYKVNRDLAIEVAQKAKRDGAKQFIFMSSIIVYGDSGKINEKKVINRYTMPKPSNFYGDSKLQAEKGIEKLDDNIFKVVILRPPMIYGKGAKGNYQKLANLAKKIPLFPDIDNERSMLYIDNLSEFIRLMIENEEKGIFFPQNSQYVKTSEMVKIISELSGRKLKLVKILNPIIIFFGKRLEIINKIFGNFVYEKNMSNYKKEYRVICFKESLQKIEN